MKIIILLQKVVKPIDFNSSQISRKFEGLPDDDHATRRNEFLENSENHWFFFDEFNIVFPLSYPVNSLWKRMTFKYKNTIFSHFVLPIYR